MKNITNKSCLEECSCTIGYICQNHKLKVPCDKSPQESTMISDNVLSISDGAGQITENTPLHVNNGYSSEPTDSDLFNRQAGTIEENILQVQEVISRRFGTRRRN